MMKLMCTLVLTSLFATTAFAEAQKTVTAKNDLFSVIEVKDQSKLGDLDSSYVVFTAKAATAYEAINKQLLEAADLEICDTGMSDMISDNESTMKVVLVSSSFVTLQMSGSNFCGGAHPNNYTNLITFDSQTGKVQEEADILDAAKSKDYASIVQSALKKAISAKEDCKDAVSDVDDMIFPGSFALGNKNVLVTSSLPHVASACDSTAQIPYSVLKPYLQKGSLAEKLANKTTKK